MNRLKLIWALKALTLGICLRASAQEAKEQTLFSGLAADSIGFVVSPSVLFTSMDEASVAIFEIKGGILFNRKLSIGPYYDFSVNEFVPQSETLTDVYMDYQSFGGFIEYTIASEKLVHATIPLKIGYGEVEMDNETGNINLGESNFLVIEPAALIELNLHKHAKLNLGLGYRWISTMSYRNLNQSDLSGVVFRAGLRLGLFR